MAGSEGKGRNRPDRLARYRAKRSAARTSEPFGGESSGAGPDRRGRGEPLRKGGGLFVVQKHRASSLHWDLRLEMEGALVSWAVPKGPSPNQADKRLAVHVEDHPLEYADFEGVIPAGSYGAGPSIVWDRGVWTPVGDPAEGMRKGKLLFDLEGYKLRGRWTLVRTNGGAENHWLLIKERDEHMNPQGGTEDYPDDSILSGLTVEELGRGGDFGAALRRRVAKAGAVPLEGQRGGGGEPAVALMMAESREAPFSDPGWIFEIKYDGYRLAGRLEGAGGNGPGRARLISRNGNDLTRVFPEVAAALARLPYRGLVLDGEVVVNDGAGIPRFGLIHRRGRLRRDADIARAAVALPASWHLFDLLAFEGFDLRGLPLLERKAILREVLPAAGPIRYAGHIRGRGEEMFRSAAAMGLEGIVAKRADSIYVAGRSRSWVKVRAVRSDDFAIHGFTEPEMGRSGFGALHLARWEEDCFVYAGRVGTGFSARLLRDLGERLRASPAASPPRSAEVAGPGRHRWIVPKLVAEVRYREVTEGGLLRHPSLLRLREDKRPEECSGGDAAVPRESDLPDPGDAPSAAGQRVVRLTNPDKPFWPEDGYAKRDLVDYYRRIASWILPWLADRPVVLTRYPDGIHGKSFFQKNAPGFAPSWIRRVRLYSEGSERELDYFVADDPESLLYLANSASIPLHIWQSRVTELARPDFCVLDLDPGEAPFAHVLRIALFIRELCARIELPAFVKTSGSTGLHILIPLGGRANYEQSRALGHLLALIAVRELGEIATVARLPSRREGKVYLDYLQNGHGRLIVAPFSVRPLPGAPVSAPLRWREVEAGIAMRDFTIATMCERTERIGDPTRPALDLRPDLRGSLERLGEMV